MPSSAFRPMSHAACVSSRACLLALILCAALPPVHSRPATVVLAELAHAGTRYAPEAGDASVPGLLRISPGDPPQPRIRAELAGPRDVRVRSLDAPVEFPLEPAAWRLEGPGRGAVPLAAVLRIDSAMVQLVPARPIDITRPHWLIRLPAPTSSATHIRHGGRIPVPVAPSRIPDTLLCSFDGWMRHLYTDVALGASVDELPGRTVFRILAPRAAALRLYLFRERSGGDPWRTIDMRRDEIGVWEAVVDSTLTGMWYEFSVHGPTDPGNEFHETHPVRISDPYARVSDDTWGRSRVWPRTQPARPLAGGIPRMEDVVAYEVHVEDFTLALPGLPDSLRGTFSGFARSGLRNTRGVAVGIDHLVDLGVNVVHLLPVQEFLHYPDAEWQAAFAGDPYMAARGIDSSNYQWGYRTSHPFALESRYRVRGSEPGAQNAQFRDLVEALHDRGIAMVVDMVFNHTAERMDGRELYHHLRVLDRHLYYRTDDRLNFIGAYGTETKSEDRPMTARWIIDQCLALIEEYGVDGFRIDLAGLTDKRTLAELRRRIGPDKIVYGEPWIDSSDPDYEASRDWNWYKADAPITFFQDDARNALCGSPFRLEDKRTDRGYAGGNGDRDAARRAIANDYPEEPRPVDGIAYLDIHDNWTLADRFAVREWNGLLGVEEGPYRIAAAMLLTSLGPVVLHGGSEFMRSKGAAGHESRVAQTASGPIYLHGAHDTYNMRTPNLFLWEQLGRSRADGAAADYAAMHAWWRGLIALRRSALGAPLRTAERPAPGAIRWIEPPDPHQLGYVIGDGLFVLVNASATPAVVSDVHLPDGTWTLVADAAEDVMPVAGTDPLAGRAHSVLTGGVSVDVRVGAWGVKIWTRR